MRNTEKTNPKKTARIAGLLYLLLAPLGAVSLLYVSSNLNVPGDVITTVNKIIANESIFRLTILGALLTQVVNIFVVLFLYQVLKPVNRRIAMVMVMFILLGAPIAMLNEINHGAVLILLNRSEPSYALISLFLDLHEYGIQVASVFWGLWLLPMGYLVFKSNYIPRIIGVLLMIGCFGYLLDMIIFFLFPTVDVTVSQFTFIGELVLPLWLLIKSVNVDVWEKRRLETAAI